MLLSLIIPTKDRQEIFLRTIQNAFAAINGIDAEILVINDSKVANVRLPFQDARVKVYNNEGAGVASARNYGAAHAKGKILLFIDDDILIAKENLLTVLALHEQYTNACFNLNWVYPQDLTANIEHTKLGRFLEHYGFTSLKGRNAGVEWNDDKIFESPMIASYFLSIEKTLFEKSGGYNAKIPLAGAEDYDFSKRLKHTGIRYFICPTSTVYHNEADKMSLETWVRRQYVAAITRKKAVELGYHELDVQYSSTRAALLSISGSVELLFHIGCNLVPNIRFFDKLYFKLVEYLFAINIYRGLKR